MTDYATDLAKEYGLEYVHDDTNYLLQLDGRIIIQLYKSALIGKWMWEVYPLGPKHSPQQGTGEAPEFNDAMSDAEGMLRYYLKDAYLQDDVRELWGERLARMRIFTQEGDD